MERGSFLFYYSQFISKHVVHLYATNGGQGRHIG